MLTLANRGGEVDDLATRRKKALSLARELAKTGSDVIDVGEALGSGWNPDANPALSFDNSLQVQAALYTVWLDENQSSPLGYVFRW